MMWYYLLLTWLSYPTLIFVQTLHFLTAVHLCWGLVQMSLGPGSGRCRWLRWWWGQSSSPLWRSNRTETRRCHWSEICVCSQKVFLRLTELVVIEHATGNGSVQQFLISLFNENSCALPFIVSGSVPPHPVCQHPLTGSGRSAWFCSLHQWWRPSWKLCCCLKVMMLWFYLICHATIF